MSPESKSVLQKYLDYDLTREGIFYKLGPLSQSRSEELSTSFIEPLLRDGLEFLKSNLPIVELELLELSNFLKDRQGLQPSAPRVISYYLKEYSNVLLEEYSNKLLQDSERNNLEEFSAVYDVTLGINLTLGSVLLAENEIRGSLVGDLGDIINQIHSNPINEAEVILLAKKEAQEKAELLKKDPTGKQVLGATIQSLEESNFPLSEYINPFFVLKGARFAQKVYDLIYPLVEKLT